MEGIFQLALCYPQLKDIFRAQKTDRLLATIPQLLLSRHHTHSDQQNLLASARKALFSIEDNDLNRSWKIFNDITNSISGCPTSRDYPWNYDYRRFHANLQLAIFYLIVHLQNIISYHR